jgi:hypothetical protein
MADRVRRLSAVKLARNLRVCWLRDDQGLSIEAIALAESLTERSVLRILKTTRPVARKADERRRRSAPDRMATAAAG